MLLEVGGYESFHPIPPAQALDAIDLEGLALAQVAGGASGLDAAAAAAAALNSAIACAVGGAGPEAVGRKVARAAAVRARDERRKSDLAAEKRLSARRRRDLGDALEARAGAGRRLRTSVGEPPARGEAF